MQLVTGSNGVISIRDEKSSRLRLRLILFREGAAQRLKDSSFYTTWNFNKNI